MKAICLCVVVMGSNLTLCPEVKLENLEIKSRGKKRDNKKKKKKKKKKVFYPIWGWFVAWSFRGAFLPHQIKGRMT